MISETLAIYGDWSTGLSEVWRDESHRETLASRQQVAEARRRAADYARVQANQESKAAELAAELIATASVGHHPYLVRKGFADITGLISPAEELLVPVRDVHDYQRVLSVQRIAVDGTKKFLAGGRTRGGIHVLGSAWKTARRRLLCEGYATGLSLDRACQRLPGAHSVIVCFSAHNLKLVAAEIPGLVCADNDENGTGEAAARATGHKWVMPGRVGEDFNDVYQRAGVLAVVQAIRAPP